MAGLGRSRRRLVARWTRPARRRGSSRPGSAVSSGPLERRVEAIAEPLFVSTGAGDVTVLLGASASVRARIPIGDVRVVLAAGGDAFATQTEYRVAGADAFTTPRIAPWLRVGVELPL